MYGPHLIKVNKRRSYPVWNYSIFASLNRRKGLWSLSPRIPLVDKVPLSHLFGRILRRSTTQQRENQLHHLPRLLELQLLPQLRASNRAGSNTRLTRAYSYFIPPILQRPFFRSFDSLVISFFLAKNARIDWDQSQGRSNKERFE